VGDTEGQSVYLKDLSHKLLGIVNNMLKRMNVNQDGNESGSEIVSKRDG
jgi:hypothetical protein